MAEEEIKKAGYHPADTNGDGVVTEDERNMYLELVGLDLASLTQVGSIEVLVEPLNPPDVVRRSH